MTTTQPGDEGGSPDASAAIADLLLVAREDPEIRRRLRAILSLPRLHREPLLNTALEEMALRGEPGSLRAAFAVLIDDEGARRALQALDAD